MSVVGPLDFSLVGILESLLVPLAAEGVSVFTVSTFDTDHVLVRDEDLDATVSALRAAGHAVG
ncbi:MAG: ACT domain-containing protein [Acidimicrobiia bacterium]|nr:ACT domain-containing protein [Acidimicrobiia bacterium]NCW49255.1 ACT domain-containing protein [Actinomycetota bacterium]